MNFADEYNRQCNKIIDCDPDLYEAEIFIVCYNGKVYKGDFYTIFIDEERIICQYKKDVIILTPQEVEHVTYNIIFEEVDTKY